MEMPQIHRPIPRRTFELTPASTDSSHPPSPTPEMTNPELLMEKRADLSPSRTRSILNLTSSTLLGIYSPTGLGETRDELSTPWGTGAQTPIHRRSVDYWRPELEPVTWNGPGTKPKSQNRVRKSGFRGYYVPLAFQTALLFLSGIAYGSITTHLHKTQHITPVPVPSSDRTALYYHITWGILGVLLGNALPIVDDLWEDTVTPNSNGVIVKNKSRQSDSKEKSSDEHGHHPSSESGVDPIWYSTVRSVGAFVGIAFAVVSVQSSTPNYMLTDQSSEEYHGNPLSRCPRHLLSPILCCGI